MKEMMGKIFLEFMKMMQTNQTTPALKLLEFNGSGF